MRLGLYALVLLLLVGCQALTAAEPTVDHLMTQGESVYQLNCQRCHHPQGQGYRHLFPNLAHNPIVTRHDPIPMIEVVKNGRGAMPSFGEALTDEEIAAVLTYVRNAWGNEAEPLHPQQIQSVGGNDE